MSLANINSNNVDKGDEWDETRDHQPDQVEDEAPDATIGATIPSAVVQLANGVLDKALTAHTRLMLTGSNGRVVIIIVPSAGYVSHMGQPLRQLNQKAHLHSTTEAKRKSWSDEGELYNLGIGRTVLAVTQDPALLPPTIHAAADVTIEVRSPSALLVRKVIKSVTGGQARGLVDANLAGLTLEQIAAAIRPGSTAAECVSRLKRLSLPQEEVSGPDARALPLFGDAKGWTAEILDDLDRLRTGAIAPADLEHVLLYGPPGTGKTVLARAVAKSAGFKFFDTSVSSWFLKSDGHLDGVLKAANAFFQTLIDNAPCIGLLDELEALPDRATLDSRHREWWNSVITGVLLMITRTRDCGKPILLVGATNYLDRVDAAVKRPGRLGRHVCVRSADTAAEVAELLEYYFGTDLFATDLALAAGMAQGATPAEVEGWAKAARRTARDAKRGLSIDDLLFQIAPADRRTRAERLGVAVHEAAHAVAALVMGYDLKSVSIVRDASTSGQTSWQRFTDFRTLRDIENEVVMVLAGRAADEVIGAGADSGSISDLRIATGLLASAELSLGLGETLAFRADDGGILHLLNSDDALLGRVEGQLGRLMDRAKDLVMHNRDAIAAIGEALLDRRILGGGETAEIFATVMGASTRLSQQAQAGSATGAGAAAK